MIIRTSPGANAPIKEGDTVTLYVSSGAGEKMVLMPYLVGLSLQQAKKTIAENDLLEGEIKEVYSNAPKGEVTEQNIAPNTKVKAYERVNLSISKGKEPNTKSVGITVPQSKDKTSIKVVQDGIVIHDAVHSKSEEAFSLTVSGTGTVNLEVYYDGVLARTMTVNL
jgi:serine/threonine-protein kinase